MRRSLAELFLDRRLETVSFEGVELRITSQRLRLRMR